MPRVVGIDPGTVSIDVCGLTDGEVVLDRSIPTADAVADPAGFADLLAENGVVQGVCGPTDVIRALATSDARARAPT